VVKHDLGFSKSPKKGTMARTLAPFIFIAMTQFTATPPLLQENAQEKSAEANALQYRARFHCRNCGANAPHKFCPECGQETALHPPTAFEFVHEFIAHYIALEGTLWRTLGNLFFKPGKLTQEYLAGRKRRYVPPLRLYLTFSVIALFTISLLTELNMPSLDKFEKIFDEHGKSNITINIFGPMQAKWSDGRFTCENMPASVCERLRKRFDVDNKSLAREISQIGPRIMSHIGAAMFVLLPLFAFGLKLLYRNRAMRYGEHLVFTFHLHAFWFALLFLIVLLPNEINGYLMFAIPLYAVLAMRAVYGGRWWGLLLRAGALTALYIPGLVVAVLMLGLWAVLF
jgi:hypothetical protein